MEALRLGVGGPVGSGKTALVAELCRRLGGELEIAAGAPGRYRALNGVRALVRGSFGLPVPAREVD
ncbi:MAG: hypothetical protein WKF95_16965 [Rubrobacter sp.]